MLPPNSGAQVKNWTAQPKVFPDGMASVHEKTARVLNTRGGLVF